MWCALLRVLAVKGITIIIIEIEIEISKNSLDPWKRTSSQTHGNNINLASVAAWPNRSALFSQWAFKNKQLLEQYPGATCGSYQLLSLESPL